MPSYDYLCRDCGHKFSVFCSISQKDRQKCPQCASEKLEQRFTAVTIGKSSSSSSSNTGGSCVSSGFG